MKRVLALGCGLLSALPAWAQQPPPPAKPPAPTFGPEFQDAMTKGLLTGVLEGLRIFWPYLLIFIALSVLKTVVDNKARQRQRERAAQKKRAAADYLATKIAEKIHDRQRRS